MSYVVLARKLRPTRFDDLVGQETIVRVLKNAILTNRVSHAFLFAGSRGVGKTTGARVLTKAINCLNLQEADPCETCQNCTDITNNASPDVFEIDAASNRGIDNIRELRENLKYVPANCRYKVYIIDEAHMLTLESFNALLKTLEEPPAHVKFILATTDPHKIPQTIISRCQRYDFVRIPLKKMADYLEKVCKSEEIDLSREALEMIARHAVGGMRDALTAIDQVISYAGSSATHEDVSQILGIIDSSSRFGLLNAVVAKSTEQVMAHFYKLQEHGHDYSRILSDLLQTVKTLSLIHTLTQQTKAIPPTLFQDVSLEEMKQYQSLVAKVSLDELQQMFHILLELEERIKRSTHAKICFEMALIQLTSIQPLVGITELLEQVQNVQNQGNHEQNGSPLVSPVQASAPKVAATPSLSPDQAIPTSPKVEVGQKISEDQAPPYQRQTSRELESFVEYAEQQAEQQIKYQRVIGVLKNAVRLEKDGHQMRIAFKDTNFAKLLDKQLNLLNQIAETYYKIPVKIVIHEESQPDNLTTVSERQQQAKQQKIQQQQQLAEQDEKVQKIVKTFPGSKIFHLST